MLVIAALQENQGQPIKASHIVTDVYIKKAIKKEVMSDPVNQLLQIKFDWPVRLASGYRDPHLLPTAMIRYMVVVLARPIFSGVLARPILADIESGTREMKSLLPGHRCQTLFSWFRVQNKPYHCMIRYMVVVLAR